MRIALTVLILAVATAHLDAEDDTKVQKAVESGVKFLLDHQEENGSWKSGYAPECQTAVSSLCVLALESSGGRPGKDAIGAAIEKGALWVLSGQQEKGFIGKRFMYEHAIGALMLAETAIKADAKLKEKIMPGLTKAAALSVRCQTPAGPHRGGWRYEPKTDSTSSDMSITGWQIDALYAAKKAGCDVPAETLERALAYVRRCQAIDGGFTYLNGGPSSRPSCTGHGIAALLLLQTKDAQFADEVGKAATYMQNKTEAYFNSNSIAHTCYTSAVAAGAMVQVGGKQWEEFKPIIHKALLAKQEATGAWRPMKMERTEGPNYRTAMALLALTAERRNLTIHKRHVPENKTDK